MKRKQQMERASARRKDLRSAAGVLTFPSLQRKPPESGTSTSLQTANDNDRTAGGMTNVRMGSRHSSLARECIPAKQSFPVMLSTSSTFMSYATNKTLL